MNKLLGIVLLGLCAGTISCSDKYVVVGVPTLQSLCKSAVEKDFYEKADQLFTIAGKSNQSFSIVSKVEVSKADEQQLQKILEYNDRVQNSFDVIELPSLLNLASNYNGWTALHYASRDNKDKIVESLLAADASVDAQDKGGETPLHHASGYNADKTTSQLLTAGANVNACDSSDETPLHRAARSNADKTTMQLLTAKANVDACNKYGETPLNRAIITYSKKVELLLLDAKKKQNTSHEHEMKKTDEADSKRRKVL